MLLLALLLALGAQHLAARPAPLSLDAAVGRLCLWLARRLDAGDGLSGAVALAALLAVTCAPVVLAGWLAAALHPLVLLGLNVAVLFLSLRFFQSAGSLSSVERALRAGDATAAQRELAQWGDASSGDGMVPRAARRALREAHHGTFALLFWFAVLPGPVGLVLHPVLRRAAALWTLGEAGVSRPFGRLARRAFYLVDWLPQRASALAFAIVGNFEDALYCWRTQAAPGRRSPDSVVLAAGAGALGVSLDEAAPAPGEPPLIFGTGEPAREDALESLAGMLWRALVLWLVAYGVLAAIAA